ncbi:DNA polymerase III, delta prime subunit [Limimonas halophila]|uniref:DNA polymerase III, delta prime subunit n=1 Tax=Limimonas halophila TaxID=1082479 RepID=A0A1G7NKJ0_9PROT|nr:DNA polymerase III subunit delta' [Limimonas halophila]SDF74568.1 DNA polymerase III, delta prime subunit [Limimonas halophila]
MVAHPRETEALIGHDAAFEDALTAWNRGRFPHARLVSGPDGVGKATFVYRLARHILAAGDPAGSDGAVQIAHGEHPDLLALEPPEAGQGTQAVIKVDEARRASRFCAMQSARSPWRIVVVDPADALNASAANALLKDLEEPPGRVLFFLISHQPARLHDTIRSRCTPIRLAPLSAAQTADIVRGHLPELSAPEAELVARLSDGAPGRAQTLAEMHAGRIYREIVATLGTLPNGEPGALPDLADRLAADHATFAVAAGLLRQWLGRVIRTGATGTAGDELVTGEGAALQALAGRAHLEDWLDVWDKAARLFDRAETSNLDKRQVFLSALLEVEAASRGSGGQSADKRTA